MFWGSPEDMMRFGIKGLHKTKIFGMPPENSTIESCT